MKSVTVLAQQSAKQLDDLIHDLEVILSGVHASMKGLQITDIHLSDNVLVICERLTKLAYESGIETTETKYIDLVKEMATEAGRRLSESVKSNPSNERILFGKDFIKRSGSNPPIFDSKIADITDRTLQSYIDDLVRKDGGRIVFAIPGYHTEWVDPESKTRLSGYVPTHNSQFAQKPILNPTTPEQIAQNTVKTRNRKFFSDRVGTKGPANAREDILIQIYLRDMGKEGWVPMYDFSSPVYVNGKHW